MTLEGNIVISDGGGDSEVFEILSNFYSDFYDGQESMSFTYKTVVDGNSIALDFNGGYFGEFNVVGAENKSTYGLKSDGRRSFIQLENQKIHFLPKRNTK